MTPALERLVTAMRNARPDVLLVVVDRGDVIGLVATRHENGATMYGTIRDLGEAAEPNRIRMDLRLSPQPSAAAELGL